MPLHPMLCASCRQRLHRLSTTNKAITITADTASIDTSATPATINAGTATVTIKNDKAGTAINMGGTDVGAASTGARTLGLTNAEINNVTAGNLVIGSTTAGTVTVSSATTTKTTTGNVTLLTGGNMAINAVLNVGDDTATTGTVEASKTLTLNAAGATSTVTDGAAGAIKATNLELLGATAAYTLDSATNAVTTLAGNTGSVTFVDSTSLVVDSVNTINSANTITGTVGLTTTGNINLTGTTTSAGLRGILVNKVVTATGSGNVALTGTAGTGAQLGVSLVGNVTANTGTINITGNSASVTGVYNGGSQISSQGAISINGTGGNIGVNLDSGSVVSLAGGSNFAGADAIFITGTATNASTRYAGTLLRSAITNNSSGGATTVKSVSGDIVLDRVGALITNASTAGAINLLAGNGSSSSTAGIAILAPATSANPGPKIVQNADADVVLTTDGQGNLTSPLIQKTATGAGNIILAAGKLLAAGDATGGQVKPPGENKPVTVVYGLTDGANGGLAANYDWSPVTVSARIQSPNKEQKLHAIPTVSDRYTRVSYLGFGGVS
jgi:hypothetical protein